MHNSDSFSNLIYRFFAMRIQFHYYEYGDILPSRLILCREFGVSSITLKAALKRLQEDGFISTKGGHATRVIFQQDPQDVAEHMLHFFTERWDTLIDLYESTEQIFASLLTEGFRLMDEQAFTYLLQLAERLDADDLMRFYSFTLQRLNSPLAMNLLWEVSIFEGLPFIKARSTAEMYDVDSNREYLKKIIVSGQNGNWDAVHNGLVKFQQENVNRMVHYFESQIPAHRQERPVFFTWLIYRERPQLCYSLALHILHQNYLGEYKKTRFLPSYEKMSEIYGTAVNTVRRTVTMLNQLGASQSINGKGTYVFPVDAQGTEPNLDYPAVRRHITLFIQALEIIKYTCEDLFLIFLKKERAGARETLLSVLSQDLEQGNYKIVLLRLVNAVAEDDNCMAIREIYGKLFELLLTGYRLPAFEGNQFGRTCINYMKTIITCLHEENFVQCAESIKELASWELSEAEVYLYDHGFHSDELHDFPSIQFLLEE